MAKAKPIIGTLFEVRNDILSDPVRFAKVSEDILCTILEVIAKWKWLIMYIVIFFNMILINI